MPLFLDSRPISVTGADKVNQVPPAELVQLATDVAAAGSPTFHGISPLPGDSYERRIRDLLHLRLFDIAMDKIANATTTGYTLDLSAGDGVQMGHEINPTDPTDWRRIGDGEYALVIPFVQDGSGATHYLELKVS